MLKWVCLSFLSRILSECDCQTKSELSSEMTTKAFRMVACLLDLFYLQWRRYQKKSLHCRATEVL